MRAGHWRGAVALVVLTLVAVACGAGASAGSPPPAPTGGRTPTTANPLRVLILGDSVMFDAEPAVLAALAATPGVRATANTILGFGLTRKGYYDWRTQWPALVDANRPEVVVVLQGAWDLVREPLGVGRAAAPGEPGFEPWYRVILDEAHVRLRRSGATVVWMSTPPERAEPTREGWLEALRSILRRWADDRADQGAVFLDGDRVLGGRAGEFVEMVPGPDGRRLRLRKPDGIHLCQDGAARVAVAILGQLRRRWPLPPTRAWERGVWRNDLRYSKGLVGGDCPPV